MKHLFLLFILISLTSCKTYVQVFETKSNNTISENNMYVFENDTLKIIYDFWHNRGILKFSIYNKLDKPLYIDWRKSSYIYNNMKINYWEEKEFRKSNSSFYYSSSHYYSSDYSPNYISGNSSGSISGIQSTIITKTERVTFIPPKSTFVKNQFYIVGQRQFMIKDYSTIEMESEFREGKKFKILEKEYNSSETPFLFRNFLTISLSEDISDESYIDNEFYVSKIQKLKTSNFSYPLYDETKKPKKILLIDSKGKTMKFSPFQKSGSFYLIY